MSRTNFGGDSRYMADEVLTEKRLTTKNDIFSLGITLLELGTDLDVPKDGALWHKLREDEGECFPNLRTEPFS